MKNNIIQSLLLTLLCMILFMGIYSLVMLCIAQIAPNHGKGFIIVSGEKQYYQNIGQQFTADQYFWSRPSAGGYNAIVSGGSNKGPSNPEYLKTIKDRIDTFLIHNPEVTRQQIPSDIVTASGSGKDPNISVEAAMIQIYRIAKIRNLPVESLKSLVNNNIEHPLFGLFGTEKINVLKLNLALDKLK